METEQLLLNKWRNLQPDKQQEVIDFINFLEYRSQFGQFEAIKQETVLMKKFSSPEMEEGSFPTPHTPHPTPSFKSVEGKTPASLGAKLRQVRQEIVDSGLPLLNPEEVEREKAARRGGYQGDEE